MSRGRRWRNRATSRAGLAAAQTWLTVLLALLTVAGCAGSQAAAPTPRAAVQGEPALRPVAAASVPGDPARGRLVFVRTGCAGCHTLQGVAGASGLAGPSLTNVTLRPTLAGEAIPMTPETLTGYLLDPPSLKPTTTMPRVGLSQQEAQDLVALLYSQPLNPPR